MADKKALYTEIFNSLDKDKSGTLSLRELCDGFTERLKGDRNAALQCALVSER